LALATFPEQTTSIHLAGFGLVIEDIAITVEDIDAIITSKTQDPLDQLYTRLAREYRAHPPVRTQGGGLPGELIKL